MSQSDAKGSLTKAALPPPCPDGRHIGLLTLNQRMHPCHILSNSLLKIP